MSASIERRPRLTHAVAAVAVCIVAAACHRDPAPRIRIGAIERCEDGLARAVRQSSEAKAFRMYREECAGLFAEQPCSEAFAKSGKAPLAAQDGLALEACRTAYCPLLQDKGLEACEPGFTATNESTARAWSKLEGAIITHDARGYTARVAQVLGWFHLMMKARDATGTAPSAAPAAGSTSP